MNEEEKAELWRRLKRIERRIEIVAAIAVLAATFGAAYFIYDRLPDGWGVSRTAAGWVGAAVAIGLYFYFSHQLEKD